MRGLGLLAAVLCVVGLARAQFEGGYSLSTVHSIPEAEPHALEAAMNAKAIHGTESTTKPCDTTAMNRTHSNQNARNAAGSMDLMNGEDDKTKLASQAEATAVMEARNQQLPPRLQHVRLSDIWKKETPCECPFNVWKPVCGVDGQTYPTECFAACVGVKVFLRADCKYVRRELWAKFKNTHVLTPYEVDCSEGDDDAADPRTKCSRATREAAKPRVPPPAKPVPFAEDEGDQALVQPFAPGTVIDAQHLQQQGLLQADAPSSQQLEEHDTDEPTTATTAATEAAAGDIEWRVFQGVRVPYYTGDVANPCPHCGTSFDPVCGVDDKTYPTGCFAECVGVAVQRVGECEGQ